MIKVKSIEKEADGKVEVIAYADTKAEVTSASVPMVGLPEGSVLACNSMVYTAKFEIGVLKSDNTWEWN